MAELILTKEEQEAETWAELDDSALGKVIKKKLFNIRKASKEQKKMMSLAAALLLCNLAVDTNADELIETLEGLTIKGKPFGDWKVTVKRIIKPS